MSRIRLAASAAMISCGLMLVGGTGIASAQTAPAATPLTQKVAVTGTKGFKGTYTIQKFISRGGKMYAVGTMTGKAKGKKINKKNVRMPAGLAPTARSSQILPPTPNACTILNLVLGPIDLNLLGLRVRTNQINVLIEGVPGAGNLLGNLLCGLTGLLDPNALANSPLGQLAAILNAILALVPRTA